MLRLPAEVRAGTVESHCTISGFEHIEAALAEGNGVILALRTGAALVPCAVYFQGGRDHLGVVRPPIEVQRLGRLREDIARITQTLANELEALIRVAPEQWHLLQPNWPSDRINREGA
jgi:KDO2-lipid IV(A) lauroyltransferase